MITFSVSWISALTNKLQNILFDWILLAAAPGIRRGCLVPRLYLKPPKLLVVWLLMNTSSAWIQITSQKTVLIRVLTIRTAETCDDFIAHKTLPCCFQLVSSFAPPNGRRWCWGEGCLWDTETGSQFSAFHPRPPPLALCLCWRTSSQLPGHVHGAQSGLITVYTWRSQLFWETRKMWMWDKYQPGQSVDKSILEACAEGGAEGVGRPDPADVQK